MPGVPGDAHVILRDVRGIMRVRLPPPQPRGLVGKRVARLLDGQEFGADRGDDAAQFPPCLPLLCLLRQDSRGMTLDLRLEQRIRQLQLVYRFLRGPRGG